MSGLILEELTIIPSVVDPDKFFIQIKGLNPGTTTIDKKTALKILTYLREELKPKVISGGKSA